VIRAPPIDEGEQRCARVLTLHQECVKKAFVATSKDLATLKNASEGRSPIDSGVAFAVASIVGPWQAVTNDRRSRLFVGNDLHRNFGESRPGPEDRIWIVYAYGHGRSVTLANLRSPECAGLFWSKAFRRPEIEGKRG
jgi:hypothetical protein